MPSLDPTKTAALRLRYTKAMNRRFLALARDVRKSFVDNDALGLKTNEEAEEGDFDYPTPVEAVIAFELWLQDQIRTGILETTVRQIGGADVRRHWQNEFIREAYTRGVRDAERELRRLGELSTEVPNITVTLGGGATIGGAGVQFGGGVHANTLALMNARVFEGLRGITESMASQLSNIFSQALMEGVGPKMIAKRITDQISSISRTRAMVMARTETIRVFAEAKLNALEQNGIDGVSADVEFRTARDARVCQLCKDLEGKVFTIKQARGVIPRHPRCLPGDSLITASPRITAVFKRHYDGDMVVIRTSAGNELSCTPNHPVLTDVGFVAAKLIHAGSNIVCCLSRDDVIASMDNSNNIPACIEDIAESFFASSSVVAVEMPMSSPDFYGDGIDGEVYVVGADVELLNSQYPNVAQETCERRLQCRDMALMPIPPFGHIALMLETQRLPLYSFMSSLDLVSPLGLSERLPLVDLGLTLCPWCDAIHNESAIDNSPGNSKFTSKPIYRHTCMVEFEHGSNRDMDGTRVTNFDVGILDSSDDRFIRYSHTIGNMLGRSPSDIFLDNVLNVGVREYHGHVYDLQTDGGFFVSNSIAVSNCRCSWSPANIGKKENAA